MTPSAPPAQSTTLGGRPRFWDATADLARVARHLWSERVKRYPDAIRAGAVTPELAATNTRIAQAIAHDWDRADRLGHQPAGEPVPPAVATGPERVSTLEAAIARARELAREAVDPTTHEQREAYAELLATLLWWELAPYGIAFVTRLTETARARSAPAGTALAA